MENHTRKIGDIKNKVKQYIQDNAEREITPETKFNIPGIYMIYINHFTNDHIVPIYIGQSNNVQKRYEQHFKQLFALNRLSYDEYEEYFFSNSRSYYEGKFKTCKIFKYMVENNCTLHDFHMTILEEVDIEHLAEKEQEYFQQLLPSFFGFNQLNSLIESHKLKMFDDLEIDRYLNVLQEDVNGITSYYNYGFTRFNFEHSLPENYSFLLKEKNQLSNETLIKYEKVTCNVDTLLKQYNLDIEKIELQSLCVQEKKAREVDTLAREKYNEAVELLKSAVSDKFKKLNIYNNKVLITNFINSIFSSEKTKYRELFYEYLDSKQCDLDFYEMFDEQIHEVKDTLKEREYNSKLYYKAKEIWTQSKNENINKRYKMIFPSNRFTSFPLEDTFKYRSIDINVNDTVLNTCHFKIYISNNGISRREDISKEPYIIRFDYCYIDKDGYKSQKQYYIDNKFTEDCHAGIQYIELDFYRNFVLNKSPFNISRVLDGWYNNTLISITAEYKHGMNDYTIKDKKLIPLEIVLNEIQQLTNEETRFSIDATESHNCLELCIFNENLHNHTFGEKLLAKKLPKIKKSRRTPTTKSKKIEDKS
ncbi:hypothetical protein BTJ45_04401 [Bacillus mycoides]|nr:hypothetical protein BTJ45_04401 [Bacillus mycoides]